MNLHKYSEKGLERLRLLSRSLQSRNFRLFFIGQTLSLIGTWMQQVAMSWLVYRLTGSAMLLGVIGFTSQIPTFLLSPFAGVLADRTNLRRVLICTQTLSMTQAFVLAALVLTGSIQVWHIIILSLFIGIINAFDITSRQAFLVEMIEKKDELGNAIALNSSMMNGTRLIGPSIAGILISIFGEGVCFLLNAFSFLAVIAALAAIRVAPKPPKAAKRSVFAEINEGISYVAGFAPIRAILMLLALVSLMGASYSVLLPIYAKEILHGEAHTFGFLVSSAGLGALISAVALASRREPLKLGKAVPFAAGLFGISLVGLSFSHTTWISMFFLFFAGMGVMAHLASSNTIVQSIVDDDKRGRVMSLFIMSFVGMTPFGSLLSGAIATRIGAAATILIGGVSCLTGALIFAGNLPRLKEMVRPVYERKEMA